MKKLISLGLVSLTVLTLGVPVAFAEGEDLASTATVDGSVTFEEDDTPVDPTNPEIEKPGGEGETGEVNPGGEGSGGSGTQSFHIAFVSNLKFGTMKIGRDFSAYAQPTTLNWKEPGQDPEKVAPFVQVVDNRGKDNLGWKLEVTPEIAEGKTAAFVSSEGKELKGATLLLNDGILQTSKTNTGVTPPKITPPANILTAGAHSVMEAAPGTGATTWTLTWGAESATDWSLKGTTPTPETEEPEEGEDPVVPTPVFTPTAGAQLNVPSDSGAQSGVTYTATLVWTLTSVPTE